MSIKYRLYGGFGVLVAMSLGLIIFSVMQFNTISLAVTKMNGISENTTRTLMTEDYLEKFRRSAQCAASLS